MQTHQDDPLWRNVGLILSQYKGLVSGYDYVAPKNMVSLIQTFGQFWSNLGFELCTI